MRLSAAIVSSPRPPLGRLLWLVAGSSWLALSTPLSHAEALLRADAAPARADAPAVTTADTLSPADCLEWLDAAVLRAEDGDASGAEARLRWLAGRCEHLPQIRHDLGVLAARADRLPEALALLEASLAEDPRAAMTLAHLRELHRREAALAYARALGRPPVTPPLPELALQDSSDVNAEGLRARAGQGELHTPATLEYELYDWWHSAPGADTSAWLAHYADDYPEGLALAGRARDARLAWSGVRREIAFTAEDAVVVLEHGSGESGGTRTERRLLLLRLQGNRWKIYQERQL